MKALIIYRDNVYATELISTYNKLSDYEVTIVIDNRTLHIDIITSRLKVLLNKNINIITVKEFLEGKIDNMKFNYIVQNPPYQMQVGNAGKTKLIWDDIVIKSFNLLKDNGTMTSVHPGGWKFSSNKGSNNNLNKVKEIYYNNEVTYAEFNDLAQGRKTFDAATDYDVMTVIKNGTPKPVLVHTQSEDITINFKDFNILPTNKISLFKSLMAGPSDEKVELIRDSSYHHCNGGENCRVRPVQDKIFKHPVVYTITEKNGIKFYYSNTNTNGHFHIPKLILKAAATTTILDLNGEYGMTEFAAGYVDIPENLVKIQKVFHSDFKYIKGDFSGAGDNNLNSPIDGSSTMFKFIKEFRKDWWKDFYTNKMEQELIDEGVLDTNGNYIG